MTPSFFLRRMGASAFVVAPPPLASLRAIRPRRALTTMAAAAAAGGGMSKSVLVPVADGSEEIESVTIIDVLVRAGEQADRWLVGAVGASTQKHNPSTILPPPTHEPPASGQSIT